MLSEVCRKRLMPAEGVTLSGAFCEDCRRIALRRSPIFQKKSKDAEGVRLTSVS